MFTAPASRKAFFHQLDEAHQEVRALANPIHRRILTCSLLDVLSKAAFPKLRKNRTRLVRLIDDFSGWEATARYGIWQLQECLGDLQPITNPRLVALKDHVASRLKAWPDAPVFLTASRVDPTRQDLLHFLDADLEKKIEPVRYPHLFYTMRNFAVHVMGHPGEALDFELGIPEPYYHSIVTHPEMTRTWALYFPVELISERDITESCGLE